MGFHQQGHPYLRRVLQRPPNTRQAHISCEVVKEGDVGAHTIGGQLYLYFWLPNIFYLTGF